MNLNSKQKSLCQMPATELYPMETKIKQTARKWQNHVYVWCLGLVVLGWSNHADLYLLAWWSLTAQVKVFFKIQ